MRLTDIKRSYLYEGLDNSSKKSMLLWESAGRAILEAQLTPQQITQLFQQVEKDATAAGGNRTLLGKGKDVASSVTQAYQNLKGKVETSATMQYFDQKYEEAAEKLKQATGGDAGVMTYVQKYRDFAKKHPIAQSLIYGALIAAAGISGAGAGGAAALGLLKMTDKLLQGEKFSSAAIKGAETGAVAYAAGQLGKAVRGGDNASALQPNDTEFSSEYEGTMIANTPVIPGVQLTRDQMMAIKMGIDAGNTYPSDIMDMYNSQLSGQIQLPDADIASDRAAQAAWNAGEKTTSNFESKQLTKTQVNSLFETIVIEAGLWSQFKDRVLGEPEQRAEVGKQIKQGVAKVAGAVGQQAQRIGTNLTTKITADKLQQAWKSAGSPTDQTQLQQFLVAQGVDADVVNNAFKSVVQATSTNLPDISKLSKQQLEQLLAMLEQPATTSPTQTPTTVQQPSMTQLLKQRQAQGLGAYESVEIGDLKTKLKEALGR